MNTRQIRTEDKASYQIEHSRKYDKPFITKVINVKDGSKERQEAKDMIKAANIAKGSKYMKPTYSLRGLSYNHSGKGFLN